MKYLAMYLPQFHSIPENDEFWGKGFTDWVTLKKAKPVFEGHKQPRVPLNDNYYDLSIKENVMWQAKLAKKYGVYGFGIYHYWFNNDKNLLTKPAEIIRDNSDIDINFFFAWDNANWKRSWSNVVGNSWAPTEEKLADREQGPQILVPYILGGKNDWQNHYNEVKKYFVDERYIKVHNKPMFIIMQYSKGIAEMCEFWDDLAKKDGFDGMFFIFKDRKGLHIPKEEKKFHYEPIYAGWGNIGIFPRIKNKICKVLNINNEHLRFFNYDFIWEKLLKTASQCKDSNMFHGAFVSYDDTPRRGEKGTVVYNCSPEKFKKYLRQLTLISKSQGKEYIFITAWNEWGEGACFEPDTEFKFGFLQALKDVDAELNNRKDEL